MKDRDDVGSGVSVRKNFDVGFGDAGVTFLNGGMEGDLVSHDQRHNNTSEEFLRVITEAAESTQTRKSVHTRIFPKHIRNQFNHFCKDPPNIPASLEIDNTFINSDAQTEKEDDTSLEKLARET